MKVYEGIIEKLKKEKLHFTLIDPGKLKPQKAIKLAEIAKEAGTDAIMIGGSDTVKKQEKLDEAIKQIKEKTELPTILFPSSARYVSRFADAIFFMSLLNSKKPRYITGEQAKAAPIIRVLDIERISMGYLIIKPGMRAGKKGKAELIKRRDVKSVVEYAMCAEDIGFKLFYLESGSGAPKPATNKMIKAIKEAIEIPLIVGGGIRDTKTAREKARAGADITVTGTQLEKKGEKSGEQLERMIAAIKQS